MKELNPPGAVISMVIVDPGKGVANSVQALWSTFCHHVFFFASCEEAERWAASRNDIEILPVAEGYAVLRESASRIFAPTGEGIGGCAPTCGD